MPNLPSFFIKYLTISKVWLSYAWLSYRTSCGTSKPFPFANLLEINALECYPMDCKAYTASEGVKEYIPPTPMTVASLVIPLLCDRAT